MKHALLVATILFFNSVLFSQNNKSWLHPESSIKKIELKVFPNPVTDYFSISDNEVVEKVIVFNLVGSPMKQFSYSKGNKYRLSGLKKGVYLVQMLNKKSKILTTKRITKR